jgi:hypothetical protein
MRDETARFLSREARPLRGIKQVVTVPQPSAGVEWSQTVPGGEQWRILAGRAVFVTDGVAGNRLANLAITVDGVRVWRGWDNSLVPATSTIDYTIAISEAPVVNSHGNGLGIVNIPYMWLPQTATIGSVGSIGDAGDQWESIALYVERFYMTDQELQYYAEELLEWEARESAVQSKQS